MDDVSYIGGDCDNIGMFVMAAVAARGRGGGAARYGSYSFYMITYGLNYTTMSELFGNQLWQMYVIAMCSITGGIIIAYTWTMTMNAMDRIAHSRAAVCDRCDGGAGGGSESDSDSSHDSEIDTNGVPECARADDVECEAKKTI